jgi:O-antigen/teichoic acid export membrane protein
MHEKLAHIAMPPALILMISAPELFALTFGEQWRESGNFAQWMAPWIYLVFVASPLSTLFEVMEKQKQHLLFQAVLLIVRIVTILGGAIYHDLELAIAGFSIGSAACWIWLLCWINRIAGNGLSNILWPSISALTWAFFCVLPLLIGINYFSDNYTWLIFLALSATLVCLRYLSFLKKDFQ